MSKFSESSKYSINGFRLFAYSLFLLPYSLFSQSLFPDTAHIRTFGGKSMDIGRDIQNCSDGGFIIAGTTSTFGAGNTAVYLIKTDSDGTYQWSRSFGGVGVEWGYSVKQTFDRGFIVTGYTNSSGAGGYDMYAVKTDSVGGLLWERTYGGPDWDFGYCVQQLPDSGLIFCGETYSYGNGNADAYVVRTDKNGDTLWTRAVGGAKNDVVRSALAYDANNFVFVGQTESMGKGKKDVLYITMDQNGNNISAQGLGSAKDDIGNWVERTMDGGVVIFGETDSVSAGNREELLIKTSGDGAIDWMNIETAGTGIESGNCIKEKSDGGFLTCGISNSIGSGGMGLHMMTLNAGGWWLSGPVFGGLYDEEGYALCITPQKKVAYIGYTTTYGQGQQDVYMIILEKDSTVMNYTLDIVSYNDTSLSPLSVHEDTNRNAVVFYPNPFSESTTLYINDNKLRSQELTLAIYDMMGREMQKSKVESEKSKVKRDDLPSGIYFYKVCSRTETITSGKLIITD